MDINKSPLNIKATMPAKRVLTSFGYFHNRIAAQRMKDARAWEIKLASVVYVPSQKYLKSNIGMVLERTTHNTVPSQSRVVISSLKVLYLDRYLALHCVTSLQNEPSDLISIVNAHL